MGGPASERYFTSARLSGNAPHVAEAERNRPAGPDPRGTATPVSVATDNACGASQKSALGEAYATLVDKRRKIIIALLPCWGETTEWRAGRDVRIGPDLAEIAPTRHTVGQSWRRSGRFRRKPLADSGPTLWLTSVGSRARSSRVDVAPNPIDSRPNLAECRRSRPTFPGDQPMFGPNRGAFVSESGQSFPASAKFGLSRRT